MLIKVAQEFDIWIANKNRKLRAEGALALPPCEILVIGQFALMESHLKIKPIATLDVDLMNQLHGTLKLGFEKILQAYKLQLDPVGHEAWMPKETTFDTIFRGQWVHCKVAKAEYVLISKAKMSLDKNRDYLIQYLANDPSALFLELAKKYKIDFKS